MSDSPVSPEVPVAVEPHLTPEEQATVHRIAAIRLEAHRLTEIANLLESNLSLTVRLRAAEGK